MKKLKSSIREPKLLIETGKQKVLDFLIRYPEKEFSLSDLAREARVAKANIGNIVEDLHRAGFIRLEKLSKIWRISANRENSAFLKMKIVYNLNYIYQSGLVEFLNEKYNNPKSITLFGSYRRGEDTSESDIDIAIETDSGEYRVIEYNEEVAGRKIQIHLFSRRKVDINVFNNIANGIVLSGFLEVRP